jgi:hypothetical protein
MYGAAYPALQYWLRKREERKKRLSTKEDAAERNSIISWLEDYTSGDVVGLYSMINTGLRAIKEPGTKLGDVMYKLASPPAMGMIDPLAEGSRRITADLQNAPMTDEKYLRKELKHEYDPWFLRWVLERIPFINQPVRSYYRRQRVKMGNILQK